MPSIEAGVGVDSTQKRSVEKVQALHIVGLLESHKYCPSKIGFTVSLYVKLAKP